MWKCKCGLVVKQNKTINKNLPLLSCPKIPCDCLIYLSVPHIWRKFIHLLFTPVPFFSPPKQTKIMSNVIILNNIPKVTCSQSSHYHLPFPICRLGMFCIFVCLTHLDIAGSTQVAIVVSFDLIDTLGLWSWCRRWKEVCYQIVLEGAGRIVGILRKAYKVPGWSIKLSYFGFHQSLGHSAPLGFAQVAFVHIYSSLPVT